MPRFIGLGATVMRTGLHSSMKAEGSRPPSSTARHTEMSTPQGSVHTAWEIRTFVRRRRFCVPSSSEINSCSNHTKLAAHTCFFASLNRYLLINPILYRFYHFNAIFTPIFQHRRCPFTFVNHDSFKSYIASIIFAVSLPSTGILLPA